MKYRTIWALLLAFAMALGAGVATAQDNQTQGNETQPTEPTNGMQDGDLVDVALEPDEAEAGLGVIEQCLVTGEDGAAAQNGADPLVVTNNIDSSQSESSESEQDVGIDEDDVLLGIALANNGAEGIEWNSLRDYDATVTETVAESQTTDLEREDIFSVLTLGFEADSDSTRALSCVADFDAERTTTRSVSQDVSLDEDDVLLAIALANSVDSPLVFEDIADIDTSEEMDVETTWDSEVERDDVFLALALGAGGENGGGGGGS